MRYLLPQSVRTMHGPHHALYRMRSPLLSLNKRGSLEVDPVVV